MGETAVITGSTRGIGLGLARELVRRGANVVVCGRGQVAVDEAATEVARAASADRVLGATCDVTDHDSVQSLWDAAVTRFGRVDIWINNAGSTTTPLPLWEIPDGDAQIRRVIDTNVLGTLHGCRVAIAGMLEQPGGGRVFNVEGMGSKGETQVGLLGYGASKAAVGYLDKVLVKELAGRGVAVCSIRPGINVTDHLLHDAEVLTPERWEKTKRVFNILGDTPETTTPWLAEQVLATTKAGTKIAWLTPAKITGRFLASPFRKRDLFADLPPVHPRG